MVNRLVRFAHHQERKETAKFFMWGWRSLFVGLGALQVALFAPVVAEGRGLDLASLPEPAYRVDGLGLALGVVWCFAVALVAWPLRDALRRSKWSGIYLCLMTIGMLSAFYARLPFVLYLGWELAGLGLWLTLRSGWTRTVGGSPADKSAGYTYKARLRGLIGSTGWVLHMSGWPLLLVVLLGLVAPFAPPAGGVAQAWPLPVALSMALVVLMRSGCPPFDGWLRRADLESGERHTPLLALYAVAAPVLLAKMLVAAPWDRAGMWALALLGTLALLGSVLIPLYRIGAFGTVVSASVCSAAAIIGFGLSPGSPLAATGAIALMLSGMIGVTALFPHSAFRIPHSAMFLGALPGVWLLSQGALGLGYGVIAALMLPAIVVLVLTRAAYGAAAIHSPGEGGEGGSRVLGLRPIQASTDLYSIPTFLGVALLILASVYPQALLEFVLRPAVGAMAGGVGALSALKSDWGVGLEVWAPAQGVAQAALPATGIALAVFLAWVALYWLKSTLGRLAPVASPGADAEAEAE